MTTKFEQNKNKNKNKNKDKSDLTHILQTLNETNPSTVSSLITLIFPSNYCF